MSQGSATKAKEQGRGAEKGWRKEEEDERGHFVEIRAYVACGWVCVHAKRRKG
jgi:hypothetical protein